MTLERRKFLSLGVLAGLAAGVSPVARRLVDAQPVPRAGVEPYTGRFFLFVNAGGGWDPTMLCDPKGGDINRPFMASEIRHAGPFSYAPLTYTADGQTLTAQRFFEKFADRLLVLNGIDMQTNNHDTGTRYTWSGHLEDGYPPLAAILAASLAPGRPLGFLSNGGYENTAGVVPLTRLNSLDTIARIARPNRPDPNNAMVQYHSTATLDRIHRAQQERLAAMTAAQTLPAWERAMRQLHDTRDGGNLLERLMQNLPSAEDMARSNNAIYRQGLVALAAYRAGVSAAANLSVGGFDTHGQHDTNQSTALGRILIGVDQIMDRIDAMGLRDQVTVMVGSDFGRTPGYNAQNGKDHWSVTSMMLMGAGVRGARVVGASDDRFRARGLDFTALTPSDTETRKLNPKSIHLALRRLAGVASSEVSRQFPIAGDDIRLFE